MSMMRNKPKSFMQMMDEVKPGVPDEDSTIPVNAMR